LPVDRDSHCAFELVAASGATAPASPFLALALALRYAAPLDLGAGLFDAPPAAAAADVVAGLPLLQRSEQLGSDGAVLSAHFATMFDKAQKAAAGLGDS